MGLSFSQSVLQFSTFSTSDPSLCSARFRLPLVQLQSVKTKDALPQLPRGLHLFKQCKNPFINGTCSGRLNPQPGQLSDKGDAYRQC